MLRRTTFGSPLCFRSCLSIYVPNRLCTNRFTTKSSLGDENIYKRISPRRHILLRPGMYIGPIEPVKRILWLVNHSENELSVKQKEVSFVPGFYKIFDEILVNASDNKTRDSSMNRIDVTVTNTDAMPRISICNNGRSIPVKYHSKEKIYIPEMVFGHLLTGSNFDDSESRITGGRHGYGAKLTNIFSREFTIEIADSKSGLQYNQTWNSNMKVKHDPEISSILKQDRSKDYTKISFCPDLEQFRMTHLDEDMLHVLSSRVYEIAGLLQGVDVYFNGKLIPFQGFESFCKAVETSLNNNLSSSSRKMSNMEDPEKPHRLLYIKQNKRWEVGVLMSEGFHQISFVNGMNTLRGGTHVNYITEQVNKAIVEAIKQKYPNLPVTASSIRPYLCVLINCSIENPNFDSQMKEFLTTEQTDFGSTCILRPSFLRNIVESSGIVEKVVDAVKTRQKAALLRKVSPRKNKQIMDIPKLEDAIYAGVGSVKSQQSTLILTEGDSAKALAVSGLSVLGREFYGVFPLRGKFLNVREATLSKLMSSPDVSNLMRILGLQFDCKYSTPKSREHLRYGKVLIMADQDHDGSHVKGLLINFFDALWPELLSSGDFLMEFITPIVKAKRQSLANSPSTIRQFYTLYEYNQWKNGINDKSKWKIKYYKGLGTSTAAEGKEYFADLSKHRVNFAPCLKHDRESIELAFNKNASYDRKQWLEETYQSDCFLDTSQGVVSIKDFIDKELIHYSHAANVRSIPSVVDGLKISQRKVLFSCFKRKLFDEVKVAQLAGYCSEQTCYHHGEASLHSTIINMAQNFVASNNLPLLEPCGQFGTRFEGGKDAASARYIFTKLMKYTRLIFPEVDDALLDYREDDGFPVEPVSYLPILPMILINGSNGIGTGWSTTIPPHNPLKVIDSLLCWIDNESVLPIEPWVKDFTGTITKENNEKFISSGKADIISPTVVHITELPVGIWTEQYKRVLIKLQETRVILSFEEHHTDKTVFFKLKLVEQLEPQHLLDVLKLKSNILLGNMYAYDVNGNIKKYHDATEILEEFAAHRIQFYEKRKVYMETSLKQSLIELENKERFIREVASGELDILSKKLPKKEIIKELEKRGYQLSSVFRNSQGHQKESQGGYDYLMHISLWNFTEENIASLQKQIGTKADLLHALEETTSKELWRKDLMVLKEELEKNPAFHSN